MALQPHTLKPVRLFYARQFFLLLFCLVWSRRVFFSREQMRNVFFVIISQQHIQFFIIHLLNVNFQQGFSISIWHFDDVNSTAHSFSCQPPTFLSWQLCGRWSTTQDPRAAASLCGLQGVENVFSTPLPSNVTRAKPHCPNNQESWQHKFWLGFCWRGE